MTLLTRGPQNPSLKAAATCFQLGIKYSEKIEWRLTCFQLGLHPEDVTQCPLYLQRNQGSRRSCPSFCGQILQSKA